MHEGDLPLACRGNIMVSVSVLVPMFFCVLVFWCLLAVRFFVFGIFVTNAGKAQPSLHRPHFAFPKLNPLEDITDCQSKVKVKVNETSKKKGK